MGLPVLHLIPADPMPAKTAKRGRPRILDTEAERARSRAIAQALYLADVPVKVLASKLGLSSRTILRRAAAVVSDPNDPLAAMLRPLRRQSAG